MADENDFQPRPGRIRSSRSQRAKPFIAQALAAAQRAGGGISRQGLLRSKSRSTFGRGRVASVRANRLLIGRSRLVTVKTRVVRHTARSAPLAAHLGYLRREGVTRDGEKARLFGPETDDADPKAFAERCEKDRHHFRFIVSPEDAPEMADLQGFTRELVGQMEKDLGTKLDWVAVDHWNTQHPHVHIIVRGVADDGQDLVISRDYIKEGMRARAQDLVTQELGLRSDLDIRHALERQVEAERWTQLDRQLARDADRHGVIDLAAGAAQQPDEFQSLKVGRLRHLESLGLAHQIGPGQWTMEEAAETTLRELGERGDIIKRIHRGLTERGIKRATASYVLAGESLDVPVIGRLVDRGLDDELKGTAYAVVDGVDGRTHHIKFPDLDAAGDSAPGSIVELRKFDDAQGRRRVALAARSDLSIENQVTASGATWLGEAGVHPVVASAARELLNKSGNERSGVLSTAMSFLGLYRDPVVAEVTRRCDWRIGDIVAGDRPTTLYLVVPPSDINRTKPLIRLIFNQIGRRLTEDLQAKAGRRRLLLMLDEFPALGRLDFFESALAFMAGYGIKSFLIAQSLNQIEKAYGPNNSILDNCHVRVSFATNDERTAKRVSDALGTATEMKAMKNYAGSRLSPWLGHLMVSRSETARPLLTPGEIMQLPPADEIVMVSGLHPIRAKKARYYEDARFQERIAAPPALMRPKEGRTNDWSARPLPPRPPAPTTRDGEESEDEDPKNADRRKQPELSQETVEKREPIDNEFALDPADELEEDAPRIGRMNDLMQGVARQASLDPGDDLGL